MFLINKTIRNLTCKSRRRLTGVEMLTMTSTSDPVQTHSRPPITHSRLSLAPFQLIMPENWWSATLEWVVKCKSVYTVFRLSVIYSRFRGLSQKQGATRGLITEPHTSLSVTQRAQSSPRRCCRKITSRRSSWHQGEMFTEGVSSVSDRGDAHVCESVFIQQGGFQFQFQLVSRVQTTRFSRCILRYIVARRCHDSCEENGKDKRMLCVVYGRHWNSLKNKYFW